MIKKQIKIIENQIDLLLISPRLERGNWRADSFKQASQLFNIAILSKPTKPVRESNSKIQVEWNFGRARLSQRNAKVQLRFQQIVMMVCVVEMVIIVVDMVWRRAKHMWAELRLVRRSMASGDGGKTGSVEQRRRRSGVRVFYCVNCVA